MNLKIRFFVNLPKIMDRSMIEVLVTVILQEKANREIWGKKGLNKKLMISCNISKLAYWKHCERLITFFDLCASEIWSQDFNIRCLIIWRIIDTIQNYEKTLRFSLKQLMIIRNIKIEDRLANKSIQVIRVKNNF